MKYEIQKLQCYEHNWLGLPDVLVCLGLPDFETVFQHPTQFGILYLPWKASDVVVYMLD